MHAHTHLNLRRIFQRFANFERTLRRFFRAAGKQQRHPIAGGDADKFLVFLRCLKTLGGSHDSIEFLHCFNLVVDEQLRIPGQVD